MLDNISRRDVPDQRRSCFYCGGEYPHKMVCPAKGKQCERCLQYNHFSDYCRNRKKKLPQKGNLKSTSGIKKMSDNSDRFPQVNGSCDVEYDDSSSNDEYLYLLKFSDKPDPRVDITIHSKKVKMTIDTGASINVIDENTFAKLGDIRLKKAGIRAFTYGSTEPVEFHGKFTTVMENKTSLTVDEIYVVQRKDSGCLLSFVTAKDLGLITLHIDNITDFRENNADVNNKVIVDEALEILLKPHVEIFNGLGKLKDSKVSLNIDGSIKPVILKQRRIPFHIRTKVDDALDKLLSDDIIETVPDAQPTPWVSPIVAVPQKDNTIRLCIDMGKPNEAIKRTRFPIPTSKDLDILLNGACYFSKLDVRQAFHQLELDEDSRYITTFTTHRGLYRYKRLNFGTNAASEIFKHALEKHLTGLSGVKKYTR